MLLFAKNLLYEAGNFSSKSSGVQIVFNKNVEPGFDPSSTLYLWIYDWLEHETKSALFIKYGDLIAFLPNLK